MAIRSPKTRDDCFAALCYCTTDPSTKKVGFVRISGEPLLSTLFDNADIPLSRGYHIRLFFPVTNHFRFPFCLCFHLLTNTFFVLFIYYYLRASFNVNTLYIIQIIITHTYMYI